MKLLIKDGNGLKEARLKAGMSQKELAELVGCPQTTISRWETGKIKLSKIHLFGFSYIFLKKV